MHLRLNALVFAVLTALVAILGSWSGDSQLGKLWLLPLALLLLGLAYEAWITSRAQLGLRITSGEQGILGRTTTLQMQLHQGLGRSTDVQFAPAAPDAVEIDTNIRTVTMPVDDPATVELRTTPRKLGLHAWPSMQARIAGPLGLAWWSRKLEPNYSMRVMPELLRDGARRIGLVSGGVRSRSILGAGAEVLQLRDYRAGDPQNLIDWKATARRGQLISRDFTEDQHLDIVVAIDVGRVSALRAGELD